MQSFFPTCSVVTEKNSSLGSKVEPTLLKSGTNTLSCSVHYLHGTLTWLLWLQIAVFPPSNDQTGRPHKANLLLPKAAGISLNTACGLFNCN